MDTFLSILLVLFFVLVNAFFSGTEMAVISLNDAKMRKLAEDGDRKACLSGIRLNLRSRTLNHRGSALRSPLVSGDLISFDISATGGRKRFIP